MGKSWNTSVGIATGYVLNGRGSILCRSKRVFFIQKLLAGSGVHPPSSYPMGTMGFSMEIEQLGCEFDYSHPLSAEINNGGAIPPLSHTSSWLGHLLPLYECETYLTHSGKNIDRCVFENRELRKMFSSKTEELAGG
jgi:hypothetical protein